MQDSGIGIAPEHQANIFHGFSQAEGSTTRRFGGTGLGLAISKRFIELMGGSLQLVSTPEVGSTFSFVLELPTVLDIPAGLQSPERTVLVPQRVLLVDDHPIAGALAMGMVRSWGWNAELASSGAQALEMILSKLAQSPQQFPFPLICTDWRMSGMDGWETTRRVHQIAQEYQLPHPAVIMITSGSREALAQRSEPEQDMLSGFLVKPFTASMLLDTCMEAANGRTGVRNITKGRSSRRQLSGMRILVVEDNLINQQVAEELLSAEGAIVSLAANGRLGVDAVALAAPQFDAILMDIQMPVLDGYGATRVIRDELGQRQLPIIAMTANAMASDREACLAGGMNEHIGKPFDIAKLVSLLIRLTGLQAPGHSATSGKVLQPAQSGVLPEIPGLDVATALARMSGMRLLYVRTAKAFSNTLDTFAAELRQRLLAGEVKKALMLLHTLKGNAGTLGATDLANKATSLESLCKADEGAQRCLDQWGELEALIKRTQERLDQAVTAFESAQTFHGVESETPVSTAAVLTALRELQALTSASDMQALQRFAELREVLTPLPDGFSNRLDHALQNLDLDAASMLCSGMVARLSVQRVG